MFFRPKKKKKKIIKRRGKILGNANIACHHEKKRRGLVETDRKRWGYEFECRKSLFVAK